LIPPALAALLAALIATEGPATRAAEPPAADPTATDPSVVPPAPPPPVPPAPLPSASTTGAPTLAPPPLLSRPPSVERHPYRALAEITALLAGGAVWYWWDADFNAPDWELAWDRPSWKSKLITFDAVRFDENLFDTNARSHPRAGLGYYLVARGNNLTLAESFLVSTASSVFWEYVVEFRERPSINDMILTPLAGMSLGEPLFRFGEFFSRGASTVINHTLGTTLSPISALNDYLGDESPGPAAELDVNGLPADNVHRFALGASLASAVFDERDRRSETAFQVDGELTNIAGYARPGAFLRRVRGGDFTQMGMRLSLAGGEAVAFDVGSRVSLAGMSRQNVRPDGLLGMRGLGGWLALGSAFEYSMRRRPGVQRDELVIANILGPMSEVLLPRGELRLRLRTQAFLNFGMIHSLAYERALGHQQLVGAKTVLASRGYYYAYGLTATSQAVARYKAFELAIEGRVDRFRSIQGLDRNQERVTNDFQLFDRRTRGRAWFTLHPPRGLTEISVELEWIRRTGTMPGYIENLVERRGQLTLAFVWR
jgi:hypothetical protein